MVWLNKKKEDFIIDSSVYTVNFFNSKLFKWNKIIFFLHFNLFYTHYKTFSDSKWSKLNKIIFFLYVHFFLHTIKNSL